MHDADPLLADSPMQAGMLTPFSVNVTVPVKGPEPVRLVHVGRVRSVPTDSDRGRVRKTE